jgi:Rrf2 family iron-sulfur cluster assembly transcriptional regulator
MRLSAPEEYGIRCLIRVARHRGDDPLPLATIAESEGLSPENAAKILGLLRKGGLVESVRGAHGGYRLARPASEIPVWEVLTQLDGPLYSSEWCRTHAGQLPDCVHSTDCSVRALLMWMDGALRSVLTEVTLAQLTGGETRARETLETAEESRFTDEVTA